MGDDALPRLSVHERLQHGLLAAAVVTALATGIAGTGAGSASAWHIGAGVAALAVLVYHAGSLAVLGYLEGSGWAVFPMRWHRADVVAVGEELRHLAGTGPRPPAGDYRVSQKSLYWWTAVAVAVVGGTGLGLAFWEHAGTLAILDGLAAFHRGCALLLLASILWHLYGVFTWAGRWSPEWSWIGGALGTEKAAAKLPEAVRRHRARLALEEGAPAADEEARSRERQQLERDEVEAELEKGNRLALGERYVEALYHYRRALELYPGYSQARYNMALVLARMGERAEAIEAYRLFLEGDPFHPLARKAQDAIEELGKGGAS